MYLVFFDSRLGAFLQRDIFPPQPWMGWLGIAITVLGFALTLWARSILGSNWSGTVTIKVDHELIRTGPYRYVRHPIYTGIIVALVGTALALRPSGVASSPSSSSGSASPSSASKKNNSCARPSAINTPHYSRTTGAIFPTLVHRSS